MSDDESNTDMQNVKIIAAVILSITLCCCCCGGVATAKQKDNILVAVIVVGSLLASEILCASLILYYGNSAIDNAQLKQTKINNYQILNGCSDQYVIVPSSLTGDVDHAIGKMQTCKKMAWAIIGMIVVPLVLAGVIAMFACCCKCLREFCQRDRRSSFEEVNEDQLLDVHVDVPVEGNIVVDNPAANVVPGNQNQEQWLAQQRKNEELSQGLPISQVTQMQPQGSPMAYPVAGQPAMGQNYQQPYPQVSPVNGDNQWGQQAFPKLSGVEQNQFAYPTPNTAATNTAPPLQQANPDAPVYQFSELHNNEGQINNTFQQSTTTDPNIQ